MSRLDKAVKDFGFDRVGNDREGALEYMLLTLAAALAADVEELRETVQALERKLAEL